MKAMMVALGLGVALGTFSMLGQNDTGNGHNVGAEAKAPVSAFRLLRTGSDESCLIRQGERLSDERFALTPEAACGALLPGLAKASVWREDADGSVVLIGAGGRTLASFALADGHGYESFAPREPLLSLVAAE